jgi:peptidoglycan L-alanyl-D-glutamate endopeptidase CwlK|tara:strand:- start:156 stop:611 length:456 start_codon:yes stop_codon:yes gene_type:complete
MTYKLGKGSLSKLEGIDERMIAVVNYAITVTKQDFSVICGMRTIEEQKVLVAKGASQTMKSKHIDGLAVDLMAYVNGGRWELNLYDEIADAMSEGAREVDVPIVWGAAWSVPNIARYSEGNMEDAMNSYIDLRRSQGRRPFIDGPHFELVV